MKASLFPSQIDLHEVLAGYSIPVDGGPLLRPFTPPAQTSGVLNSLVAVAVTPSATAFQVYHASSSGNPPTVEDASLNSWVTQHDGIGTLRHLRVFARRKPGTTGAIVAQTISIYKASALGTLLGTVEVAAAAAGADPVSDIFEKSFLKTGVTPVLTEASPLHFTCTAADTDLEVVVVVLGEN